MTDIDCRYNILSQAADDRTPDERQRPTLNSRCFCTPLYVSDEHEHLNDVKVDFDEKVVSTLISEGECFLEVIRKEKLGNVCE